MAGNLLADLERIRWQTAFRTYGNNHSTLIGLIVDWWISENVLDRWALEGGPSFGYNPGGLGGGICDGILGEGEHAGGVIEVEGTRYVSTIEKMGKFFGSERDDLKTLTFGVFLAYAYSPQGKGKARSIAPLPFDEFLPVAQQITEAHPGKELAVLCLDKRFERPAPPYRNRNEYYMGSPIQLSAALVRDGNIVERRLLFAGPGTE